MREGKVWQMPAVEVGSVVLWYPDGDVGLAPCAAIVTARYPRTVALSICAPNNYNFLLRDSVRHRDDPEKVDEEMTREGVWEHTAERITIDRLAAESLALRAPKAPTVSGKVG